MINEDNILKHIQVEDFSEDLQMVAHEIGIEAAIEISKLLGGLQIYFPPQEALIKDNIKYRGRL